MFHQAPNNVSIEEKIDFAFLGGEILLRKYLVMMATYLSIKKLLD